MTRSFRLSLYLLIGLLLGITATFACAATVALKLPANVASVGGGYVTAGSAAFNGMAFNSGMTTQIAGKAVTVPAAWRLASNAGQFAVSAVRLTPTGLITSAVAAWLLTEGIKYANGQFEKTTTFVGGEAYCYAQPIYGGTAEMCSLSQWRAFIVGQSGSEASYLATYGTNSPYYYDAGYRWEMRLDNKYGGLQNSIVKVSTKPVVDQPAVEDDFVPLAAKPLPDAVATDLATKGKALPLQKPEVSPQPQTVPLSDPYIDPKTGKRFRDQATVTPQPSTPEVAKVEITKQEVDAAGNPTVNPETAEPTAPEEQTDFCVKNPDVLACAQLGEPEDVDLQKITAGTAITPVSIGGVGSCPAAKSVNYMGVNLQISFTPICTAAGWINPIVLALAWLSAGFILIGAFKQG